MKITFLQAILSNHAKKRLAERFTISENTVLENLNYGRLGVILGYAPFDKNLYHKMLWSLEDDCPVIIIQDISSGTILTFLTLEMYLDRHPGQIKITETKLEQAKKEVTRRAKRLNKLPSNHEKPTINAIFNINDNVIVKVLGDWFAAIPECEIAERLGTSPSFWKWVKKQINTLELPLEQLTKITAGYSIEKRVSINYVPELLRPRKKGRQLESDGTDLSMIRSPGRIKLLAMSLLSKMGWNYLSPYKAFDERNGKFEEAILSNILRTELEKRHFVFKGKKYPFSSFTIDELINDISNLEMNGKMNLIIKKIQSLLINGSMVTELVDGKKINTNIAVIDWHKLENNTYHFTQKYNVLKCDGMDMYCSDIVCFVNGLPLAIIEARYSRETDIEEDIVNEDIFHYLRNKGQDEIPHLFAYSQVILSIDGTDGLYNSQNTPMNILETWYEENICDVNIHELKNQSLSNQEMDFLYSYCSELDKQWYERLLETAHLQVTEQDKVLINILTPEKFLKICKLNQNNS